MNKVYVVMGSTGEYSDRNEWPVKAFLNKDKALQLEHNALMSAHDIQKKRKDKYDDVDPGVNPYDPNMRMSCTGTDYYIMEVDLHETVIASLSNAQYPEELGGSYDEAYVKVLKDNEK